MVIRKITDHERDNGSQLDQWLIGLAGAACTTLPAFILMLIWFDICQRYRFEDDEGNLDAGRCFALNFIGGIAIWVLAILAWNVGGA